MTFPITAHLPSTNGKKIPTVKAATDGPVDILTSAKVTYKQADKISVNILSKLIEFLLFNCTIYHTEYHEVGNSVYLHLEFF